MIFLYSTYLKHKPLRIPTLNPTETNKSWKYSSNKAYQLLVIQ